MGAADSVPGVSGGTMALIVGIYEDLIASIGSGFRALLSVVRLRLPEALDYFRAVHWGLVVPLVFGIGSALVVAARFIPVLLETYPHHMRGLFLGMVAASIAIPWRRIDRVTPRLWLITIVAGVGAFLFSGLPSASGAQPTTLVVFVSAAFAICAMILPGVSGAFLLEVLGMYEPTLRALNDRDIAYVLTFGAGAALGLGSFSLLLKELLARRHDQTMAALVGLMAGALRALWPWQDAARTLSLPGSDAFTVAGIALAGFLFVAVLERVARNKP